MKFYGTVGVARKLMESYLRNRYQRVTINSCHKINGYFSKWDEVQHRAPQGSVLGPFLFLIYIDDLSKSVSDKASPILFADITSFIVANCDRDKFKLNTNEIFNERNKWFCCNLLMLNLTKLTFCIFQLKLIMKLICRYHLVIGKLVLLEV